MADLRSRVRGASRDDVIALRMNGEIAAWLSFLAMAHGSWFITMTRP
jgi:hypothetical protein